MTNLPIQPGHDSGLPGTGPVGSTESSKRARSDEEQTRVDGNPSFQVLLERLQAKARELEHTSKSLERPDDLAEAVADARASLEDAGDLGQRLLEAFRSAQTQAGSGDGARDTEDA